VSSLLGGGAKTASTTPTQAMGIQFTSSQYGQPVPVVYGTSKVGGNCMWYGDFKSIASSQKVGKGGGSQTTGYTYSASFQLGLCEGPIAGIGTVWNGTSTVNLSKTGVVTSTGTVGQAPWSHLSGSFALGYSETAWLAVANLSLGSSASLPDWNPEVQGLCIYPGSSDANPADILVDICTNANHGISFPWLGSLTLYSDYCVATGLLLSPCYDQEQTAQQTLEDLFTYTNSAAWFSEGVLKVTPYGDQVVTGNGVTYTPDLSPLFDLGNSDYIVDPGDDPITITRKSPAQCMNIVRVEFQDRSNSYHDSVVEASIDQDVVTHGGRSDTTESVDICKTASVARFIAQNLLQQSFYLRNTYEFKLSWRYCMLEPMDIVTLTDSNLGLLEAPVRITEVAEDENGNLEITAEEFPEGIGHSAIYNTQPNEGATVDPNTDPGPVNPPYLFRGPGYLTSNNTPEIWIAINGANELWGGADIWLSHDGTNYNFAGTIAQPARYGSLASALPAASSDPDTVNTPEVTLYSPATLLGGSEADADNFNTLSMVDTEIISYATATLVGSETYHLGYLRRAGYGSSNVAHAIGAPFVRLDEAVFRMPVDPSLIGQTIYLKFLSLNIFGRSPRDLSEETEYTYVVGTNVELPDQPPTPENFATQGVADGVSITWQNSNPAAVGCTSIERSVAATGPFAVIGQTGPTGTSYHDSFINGATFYYRARARGPLVQSGWSAYTDVFNSTGTDVNTIANNATVAVSSGIPVVNGNFSNGLTGWTFDTHGTNEWTASNGATTPNPAVSTYLVHKGITSEATTTAHNTAAGVPVIQGQGVTVTAACLATGVNSGARAYVRVGWLDVNRNELTNSTEGVTICGNGTGTFTQGTSRVYGNAPANACYAIAEIEFDNHTSGTFEVTSVSLSTQPATMDEIQDSAARFAAVLPAAEQQATYTPGANLLPNSIPSLGSSYWSLGTGWAVYSGIGGSLGGVPGFFMTLTSSAQTNVCTSNLVPAVAGTAMSASIDCFVNGTVTAGDYSADVQFFNSSLAGLGGSSRIYTLSTPNGGYTRYTLNNIIPPAGTAYAEVRFFCEGAVSAAGAQCYVRRIKLEVGTTATPFNDDTTQFGNLLTQSGSGQQIGDQRNLPAVTFSNYGSAWSGLTFSYSATTTSATVTASAATLQAGSTAIGYNAASVTVSGSAGSTVVYYLYYQDATHSGGSKTLIATTSAVTALSNNANVLLGQATVVYPSSGTGSGGAGGGGCVAVTAWVKRRRGGKIERVRASTVHVGDELLIMSPTTGAKRWGRVAYSQRKRSACVRIVTREGITLTCSTTAPIGCVDGRVLPSPNMMGFEAAAQDQGVYTPSRVIDVIEAGDRDVQHITCENDFFLAGDEPGRYLAHHNLKPP
jgi:hypothetical protein